MKKLKGLTNIQILY